LAGEGLQARKEFGSHPAKHIQFLETALSRLKKDQTSGSSGDSCSEWLKDYRESIAHIESSIYMWSSKRRFAVTKNARLACVPRGAREGDFVFIPLRSAVPYILRPLGCGCYAVVGEAYVHGIMYREAMQKAGKPQHIQIR
jgi:hypothetical protein